MLCFSAFSSSYSLISLSKKNDYFFFLGTLNFRIEGVHYEVGVLRERMSLVALSLDLSRGFLLRSY